MPHSVLVANCLVQIVLVCVCVCVLWLIRCIVDLPHLIIAKRQKWTSTVRQTMTVQSSERSLLLFVVSVPTLV